MLDKDISSWNLFKKLLPKASLCALILYIESFAVANQYAAEKQYTVNASQEMIALGIANLGVCWFQGYVCSGSFSRSAVGEAAGCVTPVYSVISSLMIMICLSFFIPTLYYLPKPILAAIIIVAMLKLLALKPFIHLYKLNQKKDLIVAIVTLGSTLTLGIENGIAIGIVAAILLFVQGSSKASYAILGKIPFDKTKHCKSWGTSMEVTRKPDNETEKELAVVVASEDTDAQTKDEIVSISSMNASTTHFYYQDVRYNDNAEIRRDLLLFRWDSPLFFGNIASFKKKVVKHVKKKIRIHNGDDCEFPRVSREHIISETNDELRISQGDYPVSQLEVVDKNHMCLILCFMSVYDIDATAVEQLVLFFKEIDTQFPHLSIVLTSYVPTSLSVCDGLLYNFGLV